MADEGKLTSQYVEVFQEQAPTARLADQYVEVFQDQAPTGRLASLYIEVFASFSSGFPIFQGNVGQGFVSQDGEGVGQGRSFTTQGSRSQGS